MVPHFLCAGNSQTLHQRHRKFITEYKVLKSSFFVLEASYDYYFKLFRGELNKLEMKIEGIQREINNSDLWKHTKSCIFQLY